MKTEFTISLTRKQALKLGQYCATQTGVAPEPLIAAWVADHLDLDLIELEKVQPK
jgi:hypothetical protein